MPEVNPDSMEVRGLLERVAQGDREALDQLLRRYRPRLHAFVEARLDPKLRARVDPSDVVQEALAEAGRRLEEYLRDRPLPFYPWLRQLAWERLIDLRRRHLRAGRRSVRREEPWSLSLPDESAAALAGRLAASGTSPSDRLIRAELRDRVQAALARLAPRDREVLVLRHLEQLSTAEAAAVLGLGEEAVKSRHRRALERLRALLEDDASEGWR